MMLLRLVLLVGGIIFVPAADDALVMFCVLKVAVRHDLIAARESIFGQRDIFFMNLKGRAANAYIRPVTIKHLGAVVTASSAVIVIIVIAATAAAAPVIPGAPS